MIEFAAVSGLLLVLVALGRACWRALWWCGRFERTMARTMPETMWPGAGTVPLGMVARRAVNVMPPTAARQIGGFDFDPTTTTANRGTPAHPCLTASPVRD